MSKERSHLTSSSHCQGVSSGESGRVVGHKVHVPVRELEGGGSDLLDARSKSESASSEAETNRGGHDL